ncbi:MULTISPECIES: hypothetical protein [Clostridium]|uniref:Uncharacterized protein n=4 Tax=Clostridium TaxID=1485 RepID=D8GHY1_CLOLD|nr:MULTISPECIES: hypothetical protein [Clostridium]ADK14843.1 hypothetical protein CLJU_c17800 [Clostridium ljungdahlii DSM 13528]AGY78089.1 hypothetical protein CAETHG_3888 [Clostridium autoethanogenum DSM 10061]ALU38223.1 Hypothetical protein CLAU_3796 [Clostridium autoethanogenum DSM 10061]OAA87839.1 hypothetical protein WX45_03323 [Clostridium ljungdahlii DSM 13528]OBR97172.1 hypothetical protein CLRAG_00910 [Clostridium ragsdalei P11]
MKKIDEAIDRIRTLECPTGDLENRVTEILEDYGVADRSKINVNRDEYFDKDEAQAYRVQILNQEHPIMVLAKSGYDDYVAKVTDVY